MLQTDASDYALGAILLQEFNDELRPVVFGNHTLKPAEEKNYCVTESKCLSNAFALKKVDMYLNSVYLPSKQTIRRLLGCSVHRIQEVAHLRGY